MTLSEVPNGKMSAVEAAIEFVAMRPNGPERILRLHYAMRSGLCAGCSATPTRYPCLAAHIAELARLHPLYRAV
jgi:hypothetical protein